MTVEIDEILSAIVAFKYKCKLSGCGHIGTTRKEVEGFELRSLLGHMAPAQEIPVGWSSDIDGFTCAKHTKEYNDQYELKKYNDRYELKKYASNHREDTP